MDNPCITFEEEHFSRSPAFDIATLFFFSTIVFLSGLSGGRWLSDHEAIIAQGAAQIRQGEDWIVPHVGDTVFIRKPPLPFWIVALTSVAIDPAGSNPPVSALSARLPSAIAAILTTILVYAIGRRMFGHRTGMVAGIMMASAVGMLFFSHEGQVEMVLTFFCTACMGAFWMATQGGPRRRLFLILFYVCFAFAMLAKAPFPLGVVVFPLACWWFITIPLARLDVFESGPVVSRRGILLRQIRSMRHLGVAWGLGLFLLIFLPWPFYVYKNVEGAMELWRLEFLARYSGDLYGKNHPWIYYLGIAFGWMLPFSLSLPEAIASPFRESYRAQRRGLLFAFTWIVAATVFMSMSAFKVPRYWIVCVPGCALLLAPTVDRFFFALRRFRVRKFQLARYMIIAFLAVGCVAGVIFVGQEYPDDALPLRLVGVVVFFGAVAACAAFIPGRRALCLLLIAGTSALSFVFAWETLGASSVQQMQTRQLMDEFKSHKIVAGDKIFWVDGRPDARLMYYTGLRMRPLFDDRELGSLRDGRKGLPTELREEGLRRIARGLASADEQYFIIKARLLDFANDSMSLPMREVFRIAGSPYREEDDLVLITNAWNMGREKNCLCAWGGMQDAREVFPRH